jgi:hypothetical protein
VLSGRGLCEELITRPEESYRLCCVAVCDLETSRIHDPYTYDISHLRVKVISTKQQEINYVMTPITITVYPTIMRFQCIEAKLTDVTGINGWLLTI